MNKAEFITKVQEMFNSDLNKPRLSKDAVAHFTECVFEAVATSVRGSGGFSWRGFGTFKTKVRAAKKGRNPKTGEAIEIPAKSTVTFKPHPDFV